MNKQIIKKMYSKTYDWFFGQKNLNSLIVCRILIGFSIFFEYLFNFSLISQMYGPRGVYGGETEQYLFFINLGFFNNFSSMDYVWISYVVLLASSLCFVLGYKVKFFGMVTLILHSIFLARNELAQARWAILVKPILFYVILAPTEKAYSIDAWLKGEHSKNLVGSAWPLRLMQINICTIYFVAAWSRINSDLWLSGEALYSVLINQQFKRFHLDWTNLKWLLKAFSYCGWGIELLAPFALWVKGLKKMVVASLLILHVLLEIFFTINGWSYLMIAGLTTFISINFKNKDCPF